MPPLNGSAKMFTGPELDVLETLGHGDPILVGDPSHKSRTLECVGRIIELSRPRYSAQAVLYIARLMPIENNLVVCMAKDPSDERPIAGNARRRFDQFLGQEIYNDDGEPVVLDFRHVPRLDEDAEDGRGFYSLVNANPPESVTLLRVPADFDPYACLLMYAADSQTGNPVFPE